MKKVLTDAVIVLLFYCTNYSFAMQEVEDVFYKAKPFYCISVTRKTPENFQDYPPLSKAESILIFFILDYLLGNNKYDLLEKNIQEAFDQTNTEQNSLNERFQKSLLKIDDNTVNEALYKTVMKTDRFNLYTEQEKRAIFQEWNSQGNLDPILNKGNFNLQKKFLTGYKKEEERKKLKYKLAESDFFLEEIFLLTQERKEHKDLFLEYFNKIRQEIDSKFLELRHKLSKEFSLIVFNEMFFSKNVPLSNSYSYIKQITQEFSNRNNNSIVQVNFLIEKNKPVYKKDWNSFLNKYGYTSTQEFDSQNFNSYQEFSDKIKNKEVNSLNPIHILENKSISFYSGSHISTYYKSSYQRESDDALRKGNIYRFGNKKDKLKRFSFNDIKNEIKRIEEAGGDCACSEYLCELYKQKNTMNEFTDIISKIINDNISTEICYDLEQGVRKSGDLYPNKLKIHVVSSNTLSFTTKRKTNLPSRNCIVFHVDPEEQQVFYPRQVVKVNTQLFNNQKLQDYFDSATCWEMHEPKYSVLWNINENIFQINIWETKVPY